MYIKDGPEIYHPGKYDPETGEWTDATWEPRPGYPKYPENIRHLNQMPDYILSGYTPDRYQRRKVDDYYTRKARDIRAALEALCGSGTADIEYVYNPDGGPRDRNSGDSWRLVYADDGHTETVSEWLSRYHREHSSTFAME